MFTVYFTPANANNVTAIIEESNLREFIYTVLSSGGSIEKIERI